MKRSIWIPAEFKIEPEELLEVEQIPPLPASKINRGRFRTEQIPPLDASQIVSGTFDDSLIPDSVARLDQVARPDQAISSEVAADLIEAALVAHRLEEAPHEQYQTAAEVTEAISAAFTAHAEASDPHGQYQTADEVNGALQTTLTTLTTLSTDLATLTSNFNAHGHSIPQVSGLQDVLDGKASLSALQAFQATVDGKADASHTHQISEVDGLELALSDLESAVNNKADANHTHQFGQVQAIYAWANINQTITVNVGDLQAVDTTTVNLRTDGVNYDSTNREFRPSSSGLYLIGVSGRLNDFTSVTSAQLSIVINASESVRVNAYTAFRMAWLNANQPVKFRAACDPSRTFTGAMFLLRIV